MKNFLVVRVIVKCHVVMIALNIYLSASCAAIAKPSMVEAPTIPPGHERAKIFNSGLQSCEVRAKKGINVFGPLGRVWVNGTKLGNDSRTESGTSVSSTTTMCGAIGKPRAKASEQNCAENGIGIRQESVNHLWWLKWIGFSLSPLFIASVA